MNFKVVLTLSILAWLVITTILSLLLEAIGFSSFGYGYSMNWANEELEFGESTTLVGWIVMIISIFPAKWIYDRFITKPKKKEVRQETKTPKEPPKESKEDAKTGLEQELNQMYLRAIKYKLATSNDAKLPENSLFNWEDVEQYFNWEHRPAVIVEPSDGSLRGFVIRSGDGVGEWMVASPIEIFDSGIEITKQVFLEVFIERLGVYK